MPMPPAFNPFLLASMVLSVSLLVACSKQESPQEPVRSVRVLTVAPANYNAGFEFAGEVRPRIESRLGFRVAGKLVKRQAELGQRVKAGQLLAQLDAQDYKLSVDAAMAQLGAAVTNRDLAGADYKRFKELKDQNFISGAELERRDATLKAAQAQVDQAQAQLTSQRNQGNYTNLVADVSGVVTAVEVDPGQVVSAGTPIVRIAQDGPRDVVISVPEDKLGLLKVGAEAEVRVWANPNSLNARVREVSASADPVTRTYLVKVALDSKETLPLGSTASVLPKAMGLQNSQVIKLPTTALKREGNSTAVWLLDSTSMTVKAQVIEVATADGNEAVVTKGLEPGMLVVSAGVHVLSPGQKVTIYQERLSTPKPAGAAVATPGAPAASAK
jgi:membrane fusion protein, multidrug efflux system